MILFELLFGSMKDFINFLDEADKHVSNFKVGRSYRYKLSKNEDGKIMVTYRIEDDRLANDLENFVRNYFIEHP